MGEYGKCATSGHWIESLAHTRPLVSRSLRLEAFFGPSKDKKYVIQLIATVLNQARTMKTTAARLNKTSVRSEGHFIYIDAFVEKSFCSGR